jgi:hypothetical protein
VKFGGKMKAFEIGQRVRIVSPEYLKVNGFEAPVVGIVRAIDAHSPYYAKGHASIALENDDQKRTFVATTSQCELVEDESTSQCEEKKKAYESKIAMPPSQYFFLLARLYLETYSQLAEEDKQLYRRLIYTFANPLLKYKESL